MHKTHKEQRPSKTLGFRCPYQFIQNVNRNPHCLITLSLRCTINMLELSSHSTKNSLLQFLGNSSTFLLQTHECNTSKWNKSSQNLRILCNGYPGHKTMQIQQIQKLSVLRARFQNIRNPNKEMVERNKIHTSTGFNGVNLEEQDENACKMGHITC